MHEGPGIRVGLSIGVLDTGEHQLCYGARSICGLNQRKTLSTPKGPAQEFSGVTLNIIHHGGSFLMADLGLLLPMTQAQVEEEAGQATPSEQPSGWPPPKAASKRTTRGHRCSLTQCPGQRQPAEAPVRLREACRSPVGRTRFALARAGLSEVLREGGGGPWPASPYR